MLGELIPMVLFITVGWIVKIVSENKTRRFLIEKGDLNENVKFLFDKPQSQIAASMKWGFVLIGVGIALLISTMTYSITEEGTFGLMFLFAGVGLLVFYFIAKQKYEKPEAKPPVEIAEKE